MTFPLSVYLTSEHKLAHYPLAILPWSVCITSYACKAGYQTAVQRADTQTRCENRLPDVAALLCFAVVKGVKVVNHEWVYWGGLLSQHSHWPNQTKAEGAERDPLAGKKEMSNYDE